MAGEEFAFYYGSLIWEVELTDWVKSLLLFFDGIALSLPEARAERLIESDPVPAQPLAEKGLLRNYWMDISVQELIDRHAPEASKEFYKRMVELIGRIRGGGTLSESDLRDLNAVTTPEFRDGLKNFHETITPSQAKIRGDASPGACTSNGCLC